MLGRDLSRPLMLSIIVFAGEWPRHYLGLVAALRAPCGVLQSYCSFASSTLTSRCKPPTHPDSTAAPVQARSAPPSIHALSYGRVLAQTSPPMPPGRVASPGATR